MSSNATSVLSLSPLSPDTLEVLGQVSFFLAVIRAIVVIVDVDDNGVNGGGVVVGISATVASSRNGFSVDYDEA